MPADPDYHNCLQGVRVIGIINGIELFGHELGNIEALKTLRSMGADLRVGVNARSDGGDVAKLLHSEGIQYFSLPFRPQWSLQWLKKEGLMYGVRQLKAVWSCSSILKKEICQYRPTHIHLGSPLTYSFLSLALWRDKTPLIYRMGDCPPADSPFNLRFWKMAMRRTKILVANSQFVKRSAIEAGVDEGKIQVIYNLAPTRKKLESHGSDSERLQNDKALVYVGSIAEHKGLGLLVEAFGKMSSKYTDLQLWIVGGSQWDSDYRKELERRIDQLGIAKSVIWLGQVADPSMYYKNALIHLAPSIWEEPGANVIYEAKREGTPSVVFPSGGLPEVIHHQVDGWLCEQKTSEALMEAIDWMLEDSPRLVRLGREARQDFEHRFGPKRFHAEWSKVYAQIGE